MAVYLKVARVAFPTKTAPSHRLVAFALGVIVILGIPAAVQAAASKAMRQSLADIASEDTSLAQGGVDRLRRWSLVLDLERLMAAYLNETDPSRQARIAAAYQELTGEDAARRARELAD
jgi:hypothetical protein